jgi:hypothetical protein
MASISLVPARLREGKLVPVKGVDSLALDWVGLRDRLAPGRSKTALMMLRSLRPGTYVGTRRIGSRTATFTLDAVGRSSLLPRAVQSDPNFSDSVIEVFLVEAVDWESRIVEARSA